VLFTKARTPWPDAQVALVFGTGHSGTYRLSESGPGYDWLKYKFVISTLALV